MLVLSWALASFVAALAVHVVLWRVARPRNTAQGLVVVFGVAGAVAYAALAWISPAPDPAWLPVWSRDAQFGLLYFALMAAYINVYPAIEVDSPSLRILLDVHAAGAKGLGPADIGRNLQGDNVVRRRVRNLLDERMAERRDGRMVLTRKGRFIASLFHGFRRLVRRDIGG